MDRFKGILEVRNKCFFNNLELTQETLQTAHNNKAKQEEHKEPDSALNYTSSSTEVNALINSSVKASARVESGLEGKILLSVICM